MSSDDHRPIDEVKSAIELFGQLLKREMRPDSHEANWIEASLTEFRAAVDRLNDSASPYGSIGAEERRGKRPDIISPSKIVSLMESWEKHQAILGTGLQANSYLVTNYHYKGGPFESWGLALKYCDCLSGVLELLTRIRESTKNGDCLPISLRSTNCGWKGQEFQFSQTLNRVMIDIHTLRSGVQIGRMIQLSAWAIISVAALRGRLIQCVAVVDRALAEELARTMEEAFSYIELKVTDK